MTTEVIWKQFSNKLLRFIESKISNKVDSEDLLQDVFLKIHNNVDSLKDLKKVESWIFQITRNTINDYYRNNDEHILLLDESTLLFKENPDFRKDIVECLIGLTNQLPDKYSIPLTKAYVEGKTQKAIAEEIGLSLPGIKSRIQRGRTILKKEIRDCCNVQSSNEPFDCDCDC